MILAGISLIFQPEAFGKQHEIMAQRIKLQNSQTSPNRLPSFDSYLHQRLLTNFAGNELVVVNKLRPLNPTDYAPGNLIEIKSSESLNNPRGLKIDGIAASALEKLANRMFLEGAGKLFMNSGYRSYENQLELFKSKTVQYGLAGALIRSAKAGHSEHQTGLAIDVSVQAQGCAIMQCFGDTIGGKWLADNSWRFGFIIRYPDGTQNITGYTYEPWHLRYVGTEFAKHYRSSGVQTLEELWGYPAAEFYQEEMTESTID